MEFLRQFRGIMRTYPITRGMLTYSILWPTSNVVQQLIQKREKIDMVECCRFSIFGAFYVAPTLYGWVKVAGVFFPGTSFKTALTKAAVDQILYAPIAISGFYLGLNLLEFKSWDEAMKELKAKFIPTWKTGACIWPIVQTINFKYVKEKNRVMFIGTVSFFWTIFLSYMKHKEKEQISPSVVK